jgi:hypothetical protein
LLVKLAGSEDEASYHTLAPFCYFAPERGKGRQGLPRRGKRLPGRAPGMEELGEVRGRQRRKKVIEKGHYFC